MAPKKFDKHWGKLPKEIQLRVFVIACMEPRIIRAKWMSVFSEKYDQHKNIYRLSCGPVPKILHICHQSRAEGLKHYTLIKSRGALTVEQEKRLTKDNEYRIYVNFDMDTIYFVDFPDAWGLAAWMRRVPKEKKQAGQGRDKLLGKRKGKGKGKGDEKNAKALKSVKHVAFQADKVLAKNRTETRLDAWYMMIPGNQELKTITIVLDSSEFEKSAKPHTYGFMGLDETPKPKKLKAVAAVVAPGQGPVGPRPASTQAAMAKKPKAGGTTTAAGQASPTATSSLAGTSSLASASARPALAPAQATAPVPATPSRSRSNAAPGEKGHALTKKKLDAMLEGFWENPEDQEKRKNTKPYAYFRKTEEGRSWEPPRFEMKRIKVDNRKSLMGQ